MFTRRQLLASIFPAAVATKKGRKQVAWANQFTDPLVFPPGATGGGVLSVGSAKLPPGLTGPSIAAISAIVFTNADGSYIAIADNSATVEVYFGTSFSDPNPKPVMQLGGNGFTDIGASGLFLSSYQNSGGGNANAGWRTTVDGWVHVEGMVFSTLNNAAGNPIAHGLPTPAGGANHSFASIDVTGGTVVWLSILNNGQLVCNTPLSPNHSITLDNVHYYVGL